MNKAELIEALAPYPDDSRIWFELGIASYPIIEVLQDGIGDIILTTDED